ncbi:MAG: excinuclease ABC subunit UvrC [Gammaproteobacteria bacterium]|nr:excinuclease ABC subunit UvrC [Gammaproteobacteria bacterium]
MSDVLNILKTLPNKPGVYQMLDNNGNIIYVGKAKNLKKRVSSYFRQNQISAKTYALVEKIADIKIIVTSNEREALLLENTLIKTLQPKYNIIFKDDKSYPYIVLTDEDYPRLLIYRGKKKLKGEYFGPYPSAHSAKEAVYFLQKLFRLRSCSNVSFKNRSRPCVYYQTKSCSAPCVKFISKENYAADVQLARDFLLGNNKVLLASLKREMTIAAKEQDYEKAANLRDKIVYLTSVLEKQVVVGFKVDADVIALLRDSDLVVIELLKIRSQNLLASYSFHKQQQSLASDEEILTNFVADYYREKSVEDLPRIIYVNLKLNDVGYLEEFLSGFTVDVRAVSAVSSASFSRFVSAKHSEGGRRGSKKISIKVPQRGDAKKMLDLAHKNAEEKLITLKGKSKNYQQVLGELQKLLQLDAKPKYIECFDVSHSYGEHTVASCVVFKENTMQGNEYRIFNIKIAKKSDDYAALKEALARRYSNNIFPDVIIVDGGKGQLNIANDLFENIPILAIAKGAERKAGFEVLFSNRFSGAVKLNEDSDLLHLLQLIRDEAHRFAITKQRNKRDKVFLRSKLEEIPGIGKKRYRLLLDHFGSVQKLSRASAEEIAKVDGVSAALANKIVEFLRD